jgi:hypothetical protein
MRVTVTPLEPHPNDPANGRPDTFQLPAPRLTPVHRLEAELGPPLDLGDTAHGHRRIVPLTGGTFTGSRISGRLVPGGSADCKTVLPDGTALGDIRHTLQTDDGALLDVRSRALRHGSAEVLARLAPAMRSTPVSTRFARRPRSRPPHPSSAGSTRGSSSQSAAAAGRRDLRDLSGGMKVAIVTGIGDHRLDGANAIHQLSKRRRAGHGDHRRAGRGEGHGNLAAQAAARTDDDRGPEPGWVPRRPGLLVPLFNCPREQDL